MPVILFETIKSDMSHKGKPVKNVEKHAFRQAFVLKNIEIRWR